MIQTPKQWPLAPPMPSDAPLQLTVATSEIVSLRLTSEKLASSTRKDDATRFGIPYLVPSLSTPSWTPGLFRSLVLAPTSGIHYPSIRAGRRHLPGQCDCYTDLWAASTWNLYRDSRVVVRKIILKCLRSRNSDSVDDLQIEETISMIQFPATDICASILFFLSSQIRSVK